MSTIKYFITIIFFCLVFNCYPIQDMRIPNKEIAEDFLYHDRSISNDSLFTLLYDKFSLLKSQCYPNNQIDENYGIAVKDLIDPSNVNKGNYDGQDTIAIIDFHFYHVYLINKECVSFLFVASKNKFVFFDEFDFKKRGDSDIASGWIVDPIYEKASSYESFQYIYGFKNRLDKVFQYLNTIEEYQYSKEELERVKNFNSEQFRIRTWK